MRQARARYTAGTGDKIKSFPAAKNKQPFFGREAYVVNLPTACMLQCLAVQRHHGARMHDRHDGWLSGLQTGNRKKRKNRGYST